MDSACGMLTALGVFARRAGQAKTAARTTVNLSRALMAAFAKMYLIAHRVKWITNVFARLALEETHASNVIYALTLTIQPHQISDF